MHEPSVAVVVPCHLPLSSHTKGSYSSILSQDYGNICFYFHFNGLCHQAYAPSEEFLRHVNIYHKPLTITFSAESLTPGAARRISLKKINAEYIFFADSDDLFNENAVSSKVAIALRSHADIVISDVYYFSDYQTITTRQPPSKSYYLTSLILSIFGIFPIGIAYNLIPNSGTLVKYRECSRSLFKEYPVSVHEDFLFYTQYCSSGAKVAYSSSLLASYHISRHSTTGNKLASKLYHLDAVCSLIKSRPFVIVFIAWVIGLVFLPFVRLLHTYRPQNQLELYFNLKTKL